MKTIPPLAGGLSTAFMVPVLDRHGISVYLMSPAPVLSANPDRDAVPVIHCNNGGHRKPHYPSRRVY